MKKAKQISKWLEIFRRPERKIEITMETTKTIKIRRFSSRVTQPCAICKAETIFLSPNEVVTVFQTDIDDLDDLFRRGQVHFKEIANSELQVCFSSLRAEIERR